MASREEEFLASRLLGLGHERYCAEIVAQADQLRTVVTSGVELSTRVPTCPEWTIDQLVRHVGGVVRWSELLVRSGAVRDIPEEEVPDFDGPDDARPEALDSWLAETAEMMAETLRLAGPDAPAWSWSTDHTSGFWARRMTHELAIHRADAALAASLGFEIAPEVAADTIDEWLAIVRYAQQTYAEDPTAQLRGAGQSLHLHATDAPPQLEAEWLVDFHDEGFTWSRGHRRATVALRGPLTEVLLAFYRRRPLGEGHVEVLGDRALLDHWLERATFE